MFLSGGVQFGVADVDNDGEIGGIDEHFEVGVGVAKG